MRLFLIAVALVYGAFPCLAQKRILDYTASHNWPILMPEAISNNGKYTAYSINLSKTQKWVVQATTDTWKKELLEVKDIAFTQDSRFLIFLNRNDSLGILDLDKDRMRFISEVSSFKVPSGGNGRWLSILFKKPTGEFLLVDLISETEKRYPSVTEYAFDHYGKILLLQLAGKSDSTETNSLIWINLLNGSSLMIDHNLAASFFTFDDSSSQVAFLSDNFINGRIYPSLRYYRIGMDSALRIGELTKSGVKQMAVYPDNIAFSKNGDKLFFKIENCNPSKLPKECCDLAQPNIRSYLNEILPVRPKGFLSVVHLNNSFHTVRLEKDSDLSRASIDEYDNGDYALVESIPENKINVYRPKDQLRRDLYLIYTKDGTRRLIKGNFVFKNAKFSQYGKYAIWYDAEERQWVTYRIANGHLKTITKLIRTKLYRNDDDPKGLPPQEGIAGWLENDKAVLIYDRYDIWQVDPDGLENPVNITSGYGRRYSIQLRYMDFARKPFEDFNCKHPVPIQPRDTLLFSAFNVLTKENGFFTLIEGKNYELRKLILGEDVYYYPYRFTSPAISGMYYPRFPLKAGLARAYIVQRMNVDGYPNLYFTTNFKDFKPLTDLEPQKNYLWYSSELIHFTLSNGQRSEGILYKPENFNPREKYPLIFYYYERNSDALHFFMHPMLSSGVLNIPWFVSNGYLVFVPDIIYDKRGYPGESAFQAVNAAANALSRMPWINANAMGLQGHSFGGWETNYIITRTNRFAAAASSGGACDLVSLKNQYYGVRKGYFEVGQGRIAASFWRRPELYINNSPIFKANRVNTPILILHNKDDSSVPFAQGLEWFNGLSHLQKKVWLLSYPDEGHGVYAERNQLDFSIRLAQFFDHYLKDAPLPIWMTRGTSASGNGNGAGLELDTSGTKP